MSENESVERSYEEHETRTEETVHSGSSLRESVTRVARLGLGLALIGSEELGKALQRAESHVDQVSTSMDQIDDISPDAEIDQIRHLAIGSAIGLQKRAAHRIKQGVRLSLRASGAVFGTFYALTDNRLMRPMQKPVDQFLTVLAKETDQALRAGKMEEERSKSMAKQTVGGLVDTGIDAIADNPKVTHLITEQLGAQSVGMIGLLLDAFRRGTANADDIVEQIVRKIFFLSPREELPPSPIEGKPQYMYLPDDYIPPGIM